MLEFPFKSIADKTTPVYAEHLIILVKNALLFFCLIYLLIAKEGFVREKDNRLRASSVFLVFLPSMHLPDSQKGPGYRINHSKVFTNAQSQTQTGWHMAIRFKCFSMCLQCQHLFHTYLHLKGGEKMRL